MPADHDHLGFASEAIALDAADPLRRFRDRFFVPKGPIYLDGNSLGLMSRDAETSTTNILTAWRESGIEAWTESENPWFFLPERLAARVGALVGAETGSVAVTGSTTTNLHQLLATLFDPNSNGRNQILCDALNFPSDIYAIESHLRLRGLDPGRHLVKVESRDGRTLGEDDIARAFAEPSVQVAVLSTVLYVSGQLLDVSFLTREARRQGVLIGWDLSHSIGALPHSLDEWDVDFAFWCHYKYLNAGPGAVGGLYLNRRHWKRAPGLAGWWGSRKERQFDMNHTFTPTEGAGALQIGTPHLLSLAPLDGALTLHEEAGIDAIRAKSLVLTTFLRRVAEAALSPYGFTVATPLEDSRRGGHIALVHPNAARLARRLRAAGVIPDYRPPDVIRLAPVALYNTFAECVEAVRILRDICETGGEDSGEDAPAALVT